MRTLMGSSCLLTATGLWFWVVVGRESVFGLLVSPRARLVATLCDEYPWHGPRTAASVHSTVNCDAWLHEQLFSKACEYGPRTTVTYYPAETSDVMHSLYDGVMPACRSVAN